MLDPSKHYFDDIEPNDPGQPAMKPVALAGWCAESLSVKSGGKIIENGELLTEGIYRIVKANTDQGKEWLVYSARPWKPLPGVVLQVGPGVPIMLPAQGSPQERPLLKKSDGTFIKVGEIEDLLVRANTLTAVSCP